MRHERRVDRLRLVFPVVSLLDVSSTFSSLFHCFHFLEYEGFLFLCIVITDAYLSLLFFMFHFLFWITLDTTMSLL